MLTVSEERNLQPRHCCWVGGCVWQLRLHRRRITTCIVACGVFEYAVVQGAVPERLGRWRNPTAGEELHFPVLAQVFVVEIYRFRHRFFPRRFCCRSRRSGGISGGSGASLCQHIHSYQRKQAFLRLPGAGARNVGEDRRNGTGCMARL